MQQSPEKSNAPPYIPFHPNDKFARIDNNPNVRNAEYYTPVVATSPGSYHPEFGKSPLTSVQMYRKGKIRPLDLNDRPNQYQQDSHKRFWTDIDWKKILFWALVALAILVILIGLFFLIRALLSKKQDNNLRVYHEPDISPMPGYTGVSPIYVNPIPQSYLELPPTSAYVPSNEVQDGYVLKTAPVTYSQPTTTIAYTQPPQPTQPTVRWTSQTQETYVNPVDVYNLYHK